MTIFGTGPGANSWSLWFNFCQMVSSYIGVATNSTRLYFSLSLSMQMQKSIRKNVSNHHTKVQIKSYLYLKSPKIQSRYDANPPCYILLKICTITRLFSNNGNISWRFATFSYFWQNVCICLMQCKVCGLLSTNTSTRNFKKFMQQFEWRFYYMW